MKKWFSAALVFLCVPLILWLGFTVFRGKEYAFCSMACALLSCGVFFLSFEKRQGELLRLLLVAVMVALCIGGRILCSALPTFKPVAVLSILTGLYFGAEAGFLTGSLSAVLSNFYFGQGPWTPFQMFAWGIVGFGAGLLAKLLQKSRIMLLLYGAFGGVAYSFVMDVYTVLWQDNAFHVARYIAAVVAALPHTISYIVSNVVFLFLLAVPVGRTLQRVKSKYGL